LSGLASPYTGHLPAGIFAETVYVEVSIESTSPAEAVLGDRLQVTALATFPPSLFPWLIA
jgi:hypothetical protein